MAIQWSETNALKLKYASLLSREYKSCNIASSITIIADDARLLIVKNLMSHQETIDLLNNGAVGVLPTDTLYGIVCSAKNAEAIDRLYELKHRNNNPGTIIAASIDQLISLGLKKRYLTAVEKYWPGAVSVVVPCFDLPQLHRGKGGIAVRIPADKKLRMYLEKSGPLQTSSANLTGQLEAKTIHQAYEYFGDRMDFYVDGGDLSNRKPSTVIRIVDDAIEVIREGAVKISESGKVAE